MKLVLLFCAAACLAFAREIRQSEEEDRKCCSSIFFSLF